mmetsp:Transcript_5566/g.21902  ORF Transcript_5566/g.21902 Transcript_5566/m.21902 type:complete len:630 (-) Transcript_5566:429-2318(-)
MSPPEAKGEALREVTPKLFRSGSRRKNRLLRHASSRSQEDDLEAGLPTKYGEVSGADRVPQNLDISKFNLLRWAPREEDGKRRRRRRNRRKKHRRDFASFQEEAEEEMKWQDSPLGPFRRSEEDRLYTWAAVWGLCETHQVAQTFQGAGLRRCAMQMGKLFLAIITDMYRIFLLTGFFGFAKVGSWPAVKESPLYIRSDERWHEYRATPLGLLIDFLAICAVLGVLEGHDHIVSKVAHAVAIRDPILFSVGGLVALAVIGVALRGLLNTFNYGPEGAEKSMSISALGITPLGGEAYIVGRNYKMWPFAKDLPYGTVEKRKANGSVGSFCLPVSAKAGGNWKTPRVPMRLARLCLALGLVYTVVRASELLRLDGLVASIVVGIIVTEWEVPPGLLSTCTLGTWRCRRRADKWYDQFLSRFELSLAAYFYFELGNVYPAIAYAAAAVASSTAGFACWPNALVGRKTSQWIHVKKDWASVKYNEVVSGSLLLSAISWSVNVSFVLLGMLINLALFPLAFVYSLRGMTSLYAEVDSTRSGAGHYSGGIYIDKVFRNYVVFPVAEAGAPDGQLREVFDENEPQARLVRDSQQSTRLFFLAPISPFFSGRRRHPAPPLDAEARAETTPVAAASLS